jgi:uncharacterized RDD family membrane protein YckC/type II secretory pathway pseudopilin PulG
MDQVFPTQYQNPELYAGFWKRFVAYIIDNIIRGGAGWIIIIAAGLIDNPGSLASSGDSIQAGPASVLAVVLVAAIFVLYYPLFESSKHQATPGKMVLGIKVVSLDGERLTLMHALGRFIARFLSWLTSILFYFGYWMAGVTARKQALHDLVSNCLVINRHVDAQPVDQPSEAGAGFPVWAIVLICFALVFPAIAVIGIMAAIAIPAYMDYSIRAHTYQTISETRSNIHLMIIEEAYASGRIPDSHEQFGHRWPDSLADGTANAELIDGTLIITFNRQAPVPLTGKAIGFGLYRGADGYYVWQCGSGTVQGQLISAHDGRQMTSVDDRHLPAECR